MNGGTSDIALGKRLTDFLGAGMSATAIDVLSALFLTADGPRKRLATKALAAAEPDLHAFLVAAQDRFVAMTEKRKAAATAQLTEALVTVALAVLGEYDGLKRKRAALDYDDLILSARALLERADAANWVLYKLDGGIDHILVDEAQDTSLEQWQIVAKLTEEFFSGMGAREDARPAHLVRGGRREAIHLQLPGRRSCLVRQKPCAVPGPCRRRGARIRLALSRRVAALRHRGAEFRR